MIGTGVVYGHGTTASPFRCGGLGRPQRAVLTSLRTAETLDECRVPRVRLRRLRWLLVLTLVGGLPDAAGARRSAVLRPAMPLEMMTFEDAVPVGAVGTGCTWGGGVGRESRLFMADERAVVRRNGVVVAMKTAADAEPMFLTHDRWVEGGMRIVVRDTAKVVRRGREFSETIAWLDVVQEGRVRSFVGRLTCGS